jgi:hypothetical protein
MNRTEDSFANAKHWLKNRLPPQQRAAIRKYLSEPLGFAFQRDLKRLAMIYATDKWGSHWYAQHYAWHFRHLRRKKITLLEIGIGGYENPAAGGCSLRMWRRYFSNATIVGLDFYDKSPHKESRIKIYRGDQSDETFLRQVIAEIGRPDIIIDDGSHINHHVIKSFEVLFPLLADDGMYVVEDTMTSYWPDHGGSTDDFHHAPTTMCFLKRLADGLNHMEFNQPGYVPSYYDQNITALHFYRNLVFIKKGKNRNPSL